MSADILRRAADYMEDFGFIHAAIAEGLRAEAAEIDAGTRSAAEPESLSLALTYLEEGGDR
jgi:hypothetical protein